MAYETLSIERQKQVFIITLKRAPENRLNSAMCKEIIRAFNQIREELGPDAEGAVITKGNDSKFFSTGVDLNEGEGIGSSNPATEGFYPMIHCILDFPYPTVALVTGHTFGGACLLALAHDYRVMNSERGYFSMVPVNLGLHFPGIGSLLKAKLTPQVARKVILEAHKYKAAEALQDGIVDAIAPASSMLNKALEYADKWKAKAKMNVYGILRGELLGEPVDMFKKISYVYSAPTARAVPRESSKL